MVVFLFKFVIEFVIKYFLKVVGVFVLVDTTSGRYAESVNGCF